jgi:sulfur carrier protein
MELTTKTKHFASSNLTVQALLDLEILEKQKGIAIANNVIPKSNWNIPKRN